MFRNIMKFEKAIASLPGAIQPTKVDGKWRAPEMSRRKFAELRKAAIALNREWLWDTPKKEVKERPPKGHKHERDKPLREAKIEAALAKQPELIAAHREKKKFKDKATPFELFTLTTKELKLKARSQAKNQK